MTPKLLVATSTAADRPYLQSAIDIGIDVRVLDCFEDFHAKLQSWYKGRCIHVAANRVAVRQTIEQGQFDVALIRESADDFVRTALLTQTLREAKLQQIIVLAEDVGRISLYRRCGAHQVIVDDTSNPAEVWHWLMDHLLAEASAS